MLAAKQVADLITLTRGLLWICMAWLGAAQGKSALPAVGLLLLYSWLSDMLDGPIARRSLHFYHTWLGDHDLEVDMSVAAGLLIYLGLSSYVPILIVTAYLLAWGLVFKHRGLLRSPGMLFQAFVYAGFLYLALRDARGIGLGLVVFILCAVIFTWPKFPNEVIPGFLSGFKSPIRKGSQKNH